MPLEKVFLLVLLTVSSAFVQAQDKFKVVIMKDMTHDDGNLLADTSIIPIILIPKPSL